MTEEKFKKFPFLKKNPNSIDKESLPRVLFVDDDISSINSLKRNFRKVYNGFIASNIEEAVNILEEEKGNFYAIITDYMMNGKNGDELLIKVREKYPNIKRVLATGCLPDEVMPLKESGLAEVIIIKPILPATLPKMIENH